MSAISMQQILMSTGIMSNTVIPLAYGLVLGVGNESHARECCRSPEEYQAIEGLIGTFEGVILTLSVEQMLNIGSLVIFGDTRFGIIVSLRMSKEYDRAQSMQIISLPIPPIDELILMVLEYSGVLGVVNSRIPGINIMYMDFEETIPLWAKVIQSGIAR